ncbi:MazG family protein [Haloechinothrix sp. YIM 98757]|uniref:MazG family protein n=1 Tax=Haloechinothrix aidingensis TaxID=2752311 RepID=A0A838A9N0_9PSEU|nr:MazG family protein [Haloechinothrix aidingensis]MBA0125452.1 MazG family protein [Haloechinothrix aidingensis]
MNRRAGAGVSTVSGPGVAPGTAVVLCAPALGESLPAGAVPALRAAAAVYAAPDLPEGIARAADARPAPVAARLCDRARAEPVVLLTTDAADPAARALADEAADVIGTDVPPLLEAVHVMDRLRSPGGCPWDGVQTHESLRQYLVEETYELLEAIETGDRESLREELGDVLLQVLFHARLAAEHEVDPFDIDAVAAGLVTKLVGRHPHVFAEGAGADSGHTAERQQVRWEELKRTEKGRGSAVDGVAVGQPAVALAAKLAQRSARAGVPEELLPVREGAGAALFRIAAQAKRAGEDPEDALRAVAKQYLADLRAAESSAREAGIDPATLDEAGWRRFWPTVPG